MIVCIIYLGSKFNLDVSRLYGEIELNEMWMSNLDFM